MGRANILFAQCIIALTILVVLVDHRELTKQIRIDTNTNNNDKNAREDISKERPPFLPNQVIEQYIQWHSESALSSNNDPHDNRQYALIYYYCPNRAGNILHSMFNSAIWAILHNRTILWKYDTDFSDPNTVDECQQILKRADWLPSWDEWAPKLNLTEPIPIELDPLRINEYQTYQTVVFPMIPDQMSRHEQFFRVDWRDDPMHKRKHRQYIVAMDDVAIRTTGRLYRYGVDYLLGMLFRELFTIQVPTSFQTHADGFTVALHSRHTVVGDDGSIITDETKCLKDLLENRTEFANCVVYLMSDRPRTVQMLKEWLRDRNCTGVSTEDYSSIASSPLLFRDEHGPNPGVGFIRDLALVSQARSALVGDPGRSSYMLLQEIVEYNRRIDDWRLGRESPETIPFCQLPGRYGKGYNYGPGTPDFIAHWRNQPLKPVQVLQQYKAQHSIETLRNEQDHSTRSFVIGHLPCLWMEDSVDVLRRFLHDFLRAVATKQTFLWKYTNESNIICHRPTMNIQSWLPSYDEWKDSYTRNELTREYVNSNNHTFPSMTHSMDQNELALHVRNVSFPTVTIDSDILDMLYEEGKDYLYGLLLHESIQLGSRPKDSDPTFSRDPHVTKVLWHADSNGGSNKNVTLFLQDTMTCLEPVLSNATGPCQIVVLAQDDLKYAQAISDRFPNCSIIKVRENAETESPAQVRQWLQQFSCDPTWSAFAGPRDGSIHLLRESLVFQRREMIWKLGQFPPSVPELVLCD